MAVDTTYEVALSFAGEQRSYVEGVARALLAERVPLFFDEYEEATLWGENLHERLEDVYGKAARFVVLFVSEDYARNMWPTHERRSAFAGEMRGRTKVLPVRFDETEVPGLNPNVAYVNAHDKTPERLAGLIVKKLELSGWSYARGQPPAILAGPRAGSSYDVSVSVRQLDGSPFTGSDILLVAPNGTHVGGRTDASGVVRCRVPATQRVTMYVAHPDHPAALKRDVGPGVDLDVQVGSAASTGSLIIRAGTGHIPGLVGSLNPILDTEGRTYLYADNISFNGRSRQPYTFAMGAPFSLEDATGTSMVVTVLDILGQAALLEYWHA